MKKSMKLALAVMTLGVSVSLLGFSTDAIAAEEGLCLVSATDSAWFLGKGKSINEACGIAAKHVIAGHTADKISFGTYTEAPNKQNRVKLTCKQGTKTVSTVGKGFPTEIIDFIRNEKLTHCTMKMLN
jgi:spore coat protein U-like protein